MKNKKKNKEKKEEKIKEKKNRRGRRINVEEKLSEIIFFTAYETDTNALILFERSNDPWKLLFAEDNAIVN